MSAELTPTPTDPLLEKYLDEVIRKFQPKAKIVWKDDSLFMKVIFYVSFMFLWNKTFMTRYITVIGSTIYWPREVWSWGSDENRLVTVIHEGAHMYDNKKNPLWQLGYLFPHVAFLFLAVILAFVSPWFLFLVLGAALPLPAPWRFLYETRAYRLNLMFYRRVWDMKVDDAGYQENYQRIVETMTGPEYFFTMPFRGLVEGELSKWDGNDGYVRELMGWLDKEGLLKN